MAEKINKQRIKQLFVEVANKAREAIEQGSKPEPGIITSSLLVRNGLALHGDVADLFFRNVDEAAELVKDAPAWSKSSIDRIFSEGLAALADGSSIIDAAKDFQLELAKPPELFRVRLGIFGLGPGCKNAEFGKIQIRSTALTPTEDFGSFLKKDVPTTYYYAEIEVAAMDGKSAMLRSEKLLDRHLAILNILCADGTPSRCYLSRRYFGSNDFTLYQEKIGDEWIERMASSKIRWLAIPDQWEKILSGAYYKGFSRLFNDENPFSEHLLNALELTGNTYQERSVHNAFMLLAMALETLLLGGKNKQEIANQFALRAALLSKGTAEQRLSMFKRAKRLYDLRSEVVHRGSKDITDKDLVEMRNVCLGCLLMLCISIDFSNVKSFEELDNWFLKRMLSAPEPDFFKGIEKLTDTK